MRRAALPVLALVAVAALVVIGLGQAGRGTDSEAGGASFDLAEAKRQLAGAPAPLASLHADANRLLGGGTKAFAARLRTLRGYPVVINKWAAWCGPCQVEFPFFQRQATTRGKEVGFLGIDAKDNRSEAATFLRDVPVPFPSYEDPDAKISARYAPGTGWPATVFVDRSGKTAFVHQGQYRSERDLAADIDRYLLR